MLLEFRGVFRLFALFMRHWLQMVCINVSLAAQPVFLMKRVFWIGRQEMQHNQQQNGSELQIKEVSGWKTYLLCTKEGFCDVRILTRVS